jgi:ectoine hydroxylase-related dioxygenase (phytanoyl-CoA dioxygenase family)
MPSPVAAKESAMSPRPLTTRQIDTFFDEGFLVLREVFDTTEVERMASAFERLEAIARSRDETGLHRGSQFVIDPAPRPADVQIHRVVWCGASEPVLSEFGRDPRLVRPACQLLETPTVSQLINQAHFKFPGDRVTFEWHQDSKHRRYGTDLWDDVTGWGSFVETTTAIDPMTPDNGPLQLIPGSHHQGHLSPDPETGQLPEGAYDPERAVTLELAPGDVALFGPFVVHGSGPNESDHPRRLFLNGFAHPEANHRDYPGEGSGRMIESP